MHVPLRSNNDTQRYPWMNHKLTPPQTLNSCSALRIVNKQTHKAIVDSRILSRSCSSSESLNIYLLVCLLAANYVQAWHHPKNESRPIGNESVQKIIINDTIIFSWTASSILVISNHNSFRVLFAKIVSAYFIWKLYLYFSIGNGQPREPALCQLYRRTFVS